MSRRFKKEGDVSKESLPKERNRACGQTQREDRGQRIRRSRFLTASHGQVEAYLGNIAVAGDENDRDLNSRLGQFALHIQNSGKSSVIVRTAGLEEYLRKPQSATRQLLQLDQKSACGVEIAVVWNSLNLFVTHLTLNAGSTRFRGDYAPKQIDTEPDVNNEVRVINIGGIPR